MSGMHILGLNDRDEPCPVCDMKPRAFRSTATTNVVECSRCGLPSGVDMSQAPENRIPTTGTNAATLGLLRQYWSETGRKITAKSLVGPDMELAARMKSLDEWTAAHPDLVAQVGLATQAPYTSITAICVEVQEPGADQVTKAWTMILPNEFAGTSLKLPIDPAIFAPGTIITIQTPTPIPGVPAKKT